MTTNPSQIRKKHEFNYPETLIMVINTHGVIVINEDKNYNTFRVRRGMVFYKINAVAPGVCNFTQDEQLIDSVHIVERALHNVRTNYIENGNDSPLSMYDFSNNVRNVLFGYKSFFQQPLKKEIKQFNLSGEESKNIDEYLHHFDKGFALCDFTNAVIVNKIFTRSNEETIDTYYDWQMIAVNMAGKPDILKNINLEKGIGIHHHGESYTNLEEIIDHLYNNGVKRLLMIDFSCANFLYENLQDNLTDREVRSMRTTILENEASHCTPPTIKAPSK